MKNHPLADLFPMMPDDEIQSLADDIATNGQTNEIVLYQGQILDGRNRFKACKLAGVEPVTTEFDGDEDAAMALVISLNVQRRDMTAGQRALLAAKMLPKFEENRAKGKSEKASARHDGKKLGKAIDGGTHRNLNGESRVDAAKVFKVGSQSIQQAKAILSEAPDLAAKIDSQTITLAKAWDELQARRKKNDQLERDSARIAHYREKVDAGEMTWEQAMEKGMEEERRENETRKALAEDTRSWLKSFIGYAEGIEFNIGEIDDEALAMYGDPETPGWFDHGITTSRIDELCSLLQKVKKITFGR